MSLVSRYAKLVWLVVIALGLALEAATLLAHPASAQTQPTPSSDQVNAIASQLYCPVCGNVTLDVCTRQACVQMREVIRQKLAQGQSADQIKAYFVQQYGDQVLTVPPATGLNWLLYGLPPAILIAAVFLTIRFLNAHRASRGEAGKNG